MRITIDSNILDKYNITLEEFLMLYIAAKKVNIKEVMASLVTKNLADWNLFEDSQLVLSDNTKELLSSVIIDSDKKVQDKDDFFLSLADKMQEIYPKGRKAGTTYMWRGTKAEIAKKLKTLVVKYNFSFNEKQVLSATKSYVESFNGDYTKMRLLKYFVLKIERDADNNPVLISELMSLIENEGQDDTTTNRDWTTELV